ncbi:MAG: RnfABCDGE type electron transport complex subunit D [Lachnospiraceae bacterium]
MEKLFHVSSSPHVRAKDTTRSIMLDVAAALLPATAVGIFNFGLSALLVILVTVGTCIITEYAYEKGMKKPITIYDGSALVTGLLLALNLPSTIPLWIAMIGGIFAILIVKQLYGGLGQNFMNPALAARCFLLISFAGRMTSFTYDGVTGATPLAVLKNGGEVNLLSMFIGTTAGTIGETSVIAILLGAAYLLAKKVISIRIPACYIITFALFILIFGGHGFDLSYLAAHLCGGGLMLGAFFMATDYVTSPITEKGQIVFGILLGILTGIFRIFGKSAEGVSYAIIFCNLLVPLIERYTMPTAFGWEGKKNEK